MARTPLVITVDDENLAAWTLINNTFRYPSSGTFDRTTQFWNGLLFQFGRFDGRLGSPLKPFEKIVFMNTVGAVKHEMTWSDFCDTDTWINVVFHRNPQERADPMRGGHVPLLIPKDGQDPSRLHNFLKPSSGGMSVWFDRETGFDLKVTKSAYEHAKSVFSLARYYTYNTAEVDFLVTVNIYSPYSTVVNLDGADIAAIHISARGGPDDGDQKNPPQIRPRI